MAAEHPRPRATSIPSHTRIAYRPDKAALSPLSIRPSLTGPGCARSCIRRDRCASACELPPPPHLPTTLRTDETAAADDDHEHEDAMLSVPHLDAGGGLAVAPALPAKSALRTSRLLATLAQKNASEERPMLPHAAPHQLYLSSEEDGSSSADDLSDLDEADWDGADSARSSVSRSSREDTARIVTVIFHGRPSMVDLPARPSYADSSDGLRPATGILRTATEPTLTRTRSSSSSASSNNMMHHPPRSSSMMSTGFHLKRPHFLTINPFAVKATPELDEPDSATRTPKTTSTMLKKTLSLVKKRSRPMLANAVTSPSHEGVALAPTTLMEQLGEEAEAEAVTAREAAATAPRPALTYQDIMRRTRRSTETTMTTPPLPDSALASSSHKSRFRTGLSINRPRSGVRA